MDDDPEGYGREWEHTLELWHELERVMPIDE